MDFKSMLASLWVPFFVLLAFIPGSALNAIERRSTTKMTALSSTELELANTITEIERKTPSLRNDAINDKTIQRSLSMTESTKDIEGHFFGRKERNEQKAIKIAHGTAAGGEMQPTTKTLTTLLTSGGTVYKRTTPTATKTTAKTAMSTKEKTTATTTTETTSSKNINKNTRAGMFAKMNVSFSLERKDLFNPPAKEPDLASTMVNIIQLEKAPLSSATTIIETEITTTAPKTTALPLRSPWIQVTKAPVSAALSVAIETPVLLVIEKRTLNNNNNSNTATNSNNFKNSNTSNMDKNQSKFNISISWKNLTSQIDFNGTSSPPPQPLPSPKYFHGSQSQQHQMDNRKRFITHSHKKLEHAASTRDALVDCMGIDCLKTINENQLLIKASLTANKTYTETSTALPTAKHLTQSTLPGDITAITAEIPPLTSSSSTTTTTTTIKSTVKPRRVVATTTLKPPPTIDDYRTIISQAGTHAYLPCNVKQLVKKPISWLRVRDGHILTVDQTTFIADQRFQSIYSPNPERWSLQIKYVQLKDAGTYECQVSTEPKASAIIKLHIVEPKTELLGESTRHVKAGSQVKLRCIISQALEPPLFINWFYNQKQIYLHNRKGWRTEIERIDLPPETTTTSTTTTTKTTTTVRPTPTTTTILMSTLPSSTTPMTVIAGVGNADNDDGFSNAEISPESESTMATTATVTHFSSSATYDGNAGTVSSTISTMLPTPLAELRVPAMTMSMTTMAAVGVADVKQITAASLIIASVGKQDSGNYTCSPSNSAPRTVVLHVLNGEYSASAITSGCGSNILMAYNILSQWPHGTTAILILLWLIKIFVAMDFQWTCSQIRNKTRHERHVYKGLATDYGCSCERLSNYKLCSK